jgi:hypothetical protein
LLYILQASEISWPQVALWGPTIIILMLVLGFLIRMAPIWKDVRFRELEVREKENETRGQIAQSLTQLGAGLTALGTGLGEMSGVLRDVAVEQRKATEVLEIIQRYQVDRDDQLDFKVRALDERIVKIERIERGDESHVQSERPRA